MKLIKRAALIHMLLICCFAEFCSYTDAHNLDSDFVSKGPGNNCEKERKENADCHKGLYNFYLTLCDNDMDCMFKNGYILQPLLCDSLYEPVPGFCLD
jgi:hypothetical protein